MPRYITNTRGHKPTEPLHVCILSAGLGYREKSKGPKVLQLLDGVTVLELQTKTILRSNPDARICVTAGFQSEKVIRFKPAAVTVIENQLWETHNSIEEVRLYLNSVHAKRVLFVDGAVAFTKVALSIVDSPSIFVYSTKESNEVGVSINEGLVEHFSYGLENKWSGLVYLEDKSLEVFKQICTKENRQLSLFETLNLLISRGVQLKVKSSNRNEIVKVY